MATLQEQKYKVYQKQASNATLPPCNLVWNHDLSVPFFLGSAYFVNLEGSVRSQRRLQSEVSFHLSVEAIGKIRP